MRSRSYEAIDGCCTQGRLDPVANCGLYTASYLLCSGLVQHVDHAWAFAIRVGLVTGLVTGVGSATIPMIEFHAENLLERRMGALGIVLILFGFALQSLQYWLVVLDVRVT